MEFDRRFLYVFFISAVVRFGECGICFLGECTSGFCKNKIENFSMTEENCCKDSKNFGFYPYPLLQYKNDDTCYRCRKCSEFLHFVSQSKNIRPENGGWSPWSEWSQCSKTCGNGNRYQMRSCDNPIPSLTGSSCVGESVQIESCNDATCSPIKNTKTPPKLSKLGEWSSWSQCSRTCNGGIQYRKKSCNNPPPIFLESYCSSDSPSCEIKECNQHRCIIDGGWSVWSDWTICSKTCGEGEQIRNRHCNTPEPKFGGKNCDGHPTETQICNKHQCPVIGGWSEWSDWSHCSKSCKGGLQTRYRHCDNPVPQMGGKYCNGNKTETQICNEKECPVDGGWSIWSEWNKCNKICNGGQQTRNRHCNNPKPKFGGGKCDGNKTEIQKCNRQKCPVNGEWSVWSDWSQCSNNGQQTRYRHCDNPMPRFNGNYCAGEKMQIKDCNKEKCPVNGGWNEWSTWSSCNTECGSGTQTRTRNCDNPTPAYNGKDCDGNKTDIQSCLGVNCSDEYWTAWEPWQCFGCVSAVRKRYCLQPKRRCYDQGESYEKIKYGTEEFRKACRHTCNKL